MNYYETIQALETLEGLEVRLGVFGPGSGSAPLVSMVGVLGRIHSPTAPAALEDHVENRATSFRIDGRENDLTLWPDRFVSAEIDQLGVLEIVSLDGVVRIQRDEPPWM